MRPQIFPTFTSILITGMLFTSGCGLTVNVAFATPSITPIIATSIPAGAVLPTLTPLPLLPSPTALPPTPTQTATPTSPTLLGNAASVIQTIAPTPTPIPATSTVPPPPSQPTQVVLPQLKIFDKDGTNMDGQVLGVSVPKSLMSFQVITCVPDCKSKSDGAGVVNVDFAFFKIKTQSRADVKNKTPVYKTTERNKPYCAFGGNNPCPNWVFAEHAGKWPNGANIESGDYTLFVQANGTPQNNGHWESVVNFTIQR